MLKLAGLSFYSKDRNEDMPLIIAGGPCSINPEPYADFFDIIIIGEGEESLNSLCSLYIEKKGLGRERFLNEAAQIEGVYVPSFSDIEYDNAGRITGIKTKYPVKKAYVRNFDKAYFPQNVIVPNVEAVHDRGIIELYRGCSNGCRFCQAGFLTRPVRHRSAETLYSQAKGLIKGTGFEEISLSSLSTGDYPELLQLTEMLRPLKENGTSFSLPSLRLSGYLSGFACGGGSLTFAPEAGTQRLRDVINKNISDSDIDNAFREAFSQGLKNLKLYFMCGLPTETEEDIDGIVEIALRAKRLHKEAKCGGKLNISVSCAVFIPKPLTPFEWEAMEGKESILKKQLKIKNLLSKENIRFSYHDYDSSRIEGIFSRGDRRLSGVLVKAYESGCILDGWSEYFDNEKWEKAFNECGTNPDFYLSERKTDEILPWDFIGGCVSKKYLAKEREKAYKGIVTKDCRFGCNACGVNKGDCGIC
jgi:radical SAM family uncharacterized protein